MNQMQSYEERCKILEYFSRKPDDFDTIMSLIATQQSKETHVGTQKTEQKEVSSARTEHRRDSCYPTVMRRILIGVSNTCFQSTTRRGRSFQMQMSIFCRKFTLKLVTTDMTDVFNLDFS